MKSGHVQDYQVTASSIFRTLNMDMFTWEPGKARLDKQGKVNAWTAGHSDQSQWLQVRIYLTSSSREINNSLPSSCWRIIFDLPGTVIDGVLTVDTSMTSLLHTVSAVNKTYTS